jgi:hypothetical protein
MTKDQANYVRFIGTRAARGSATNPLDCENTTKFRCVDAPPRAARTMSGLSVRALRHAVARQRGHTAARAAIAREFPA